MLGEMVMELLVTIIGQLYLSNVNLSQEITFLFLHVKAILENLVDMLENVVFALDGKMTIMKTFFC